MKECDVATEEPPTLTNTQTSLVQEQEPAEGDARTGTLDEADTLNKQTELTFVGDSWTNTETLRAVRSVILWTMQSAFDLVAAEVFWAQYQLDPIMNKLAGHDPVGIPASVRQELQHRTFSQELNLTQMDTRGESVAVYHADVLNADLTDWAGALTDLIKVTYNPRPLEVEEIRGRITGILRELGVGDDVDPRGSLYLPNTVLERLTRPS